MSSKVGIKRKTSISSLKKRFIDWALQDLNEKSQVAKNKGVTQSSQNPMVHNTVHQTHCQPELQEIINRWDELPEHVRQTIKMLVESSK